MYILAMHKLHERSVRILELYLDPSSQILNLALLNGTQELFGLCIFF